MKSRREVKEEKEVIEMKGGGADIGQVPLLREIRIAYCATTQV